jgi:septum formation protein
MGLQVYLASASPRRRELLAQIGISYEVIESGVAEQPRPQEDARDYVRRLARDKAQAVLAQVRARRLPPRPVVAADTEVVIDGEILGKPADRAEGEAMLRRLSGRTHEVLTGVCVLREHPVEGAPAERLVLSVSRVTFGRLSEDDIARYWDTGEPADKAGGYAIQGHAARFVAYLEGSYSGVMGLPLYELTQALKELELDLEWSDRE